MQQCHFLGGKALYQVEGFYNHRFSKKKLTWGLFLPDVEVPTNIKGI